MGLSYEYLKTHLCQGLFTRISEEYNIYHVNSRAGPLLLFLMIQRLIASNDSIAHTFSQKIESALTLRLVSFGVTCDEIMLAAVVNVYVLGSRVGTNASVSLFRYLRCNHFSRCGKRLCVGFKGYVRSNSLHNCL
jgi:hypothetical protein